MLARGVYLECGAATAEPTPADLLFVELDRRRLKGFPNDAVVEVFGIHVVEGRGTWVQLAPVGHSHQSFILFLPPTATVDQAVTALRAWGRIPPGSRPRLMEVMPLP